MKIKQWIIKKLFKISIPNFALEDSKQGVITDEMRAKALETRRLNHAVTQAEKRFEIQKRIESLENLNKSSGNDSMEDMLFKQAIPILMAKISGETPPPLPPSIEEPTPQGVEQPKQIEFSNEQIKGIIDGNPNLKQFGKQFSDDELNKYIKTQIPNVSEDSIKKMIVEVRT